MSDINEVYSDDNILLTNLFYQPPLRTGVII